MEKLPISGMVNFVVEWKKEDQMRVINTWKVKSWESACMYLNGKECK